MSRTIHGGRRDDVVSALKAALAIGLDFKLQDRVSMGHLATEEGRKFIDAFPGEGQDLDSLLAEFSDKVIPYCLNYGSSNFMGFPDAGHSTAALAGAILKEFLQQDLMNQRCCGPAATFLEIAVIRWLREAIGYPVGEIGSIWDVGGAVTPGGTLSNTLAMLLARENRRPDTMVNGIDRADDFHIVVPEGISHYSIRGAVMWLGCGARFLQVRTRNYRYDLGELESTLRRHAGGIMAVVANAGESKTMTVDRLPEIHDLTRSVDPGIWLHADACHGFSLAFSERLRARLQGIERFDSVSMDPHKVMLIPYTLSVLAVRNPDDMKRIQSRSNLILGEEWDLGRITPFLGTKAWDSLKLWFMMKHYGARGLDELITRRHELAKHLERKLTGDDEFVVVNDVEINAVAFLYTGGIDRGDIDTLNSVSRRIYRSMLQAGRYYLHQFPMTDAGRIEEGVEIHPLRYMCGNPDTTVEDVDAMVEYIRGLGRLVVSQAYPCGDRPADADGVRN